MHKFILSLAALAVLSPPAAALTAAETAAVKRAEAYMNSLGNLQSRFIQVNPDGSSHEGELFVARPGKMRINYDPPTPMLVVADGTWLIYVDKDVNETSYLDLNDTPAGLLLKPNMSFTDKAVQLKGVKLGKNTVEITAAQAKDPATGQLTFVFSDAPFELRQWRVLDAQKQEVAVTLMEPKYGGKIDPKIFQYQKPDDARDPDRRGDD
ncbi:MAG: outer membrane lipoprotein carrier protein LolA [Rhodospirillaceae bacterium]|nr:outer membrane lipoprotein carrier protein LolA [Rhodospirillaceae bacterium]